MPQEPLIENPERIAVIGMAGRLSGARDLEAFWRLLSEGREGIQFFSEMDLRRSGVDPWRLAQKNFVPATGIVEGVDLFDAEFFGYSRREAEWMDPQHRVFLECAWEALENAHCLPDRFEGVIGVFAGVGLNHYFLSHAGAEATLDPAGEFARFVASDKDFLASRAAYKLNLKGPAITVQTACSTSLVAVHLACQSLLNYECDAALAGGVTLVLPQHRGYLFQEGMILSPDGRCRAFDAQAQGTCPGSGAGVVVLKRLSEALAQGDDIDAVILGSAVTNDGSDKVGYTAPGVRGQARAITSALAVAGVHPETITYVETHGTGTPMGDPVELAALNQAYRAFTTERAFCAIGSVKTNIGHCDTAAGVAGLIKTVLALKHRQIPPSLHFASPNPEIDFANSPFFVNTRLADWRARGAVRRAGVSSFGLGGTNAHVILEEAPPPGERPDRSSSGPCLLPLSAHNDAALASLANAYRKFIEASPGQLWDLCYTASLHRHHHPARLGVAAMNETEMRERLAEIESNPNPSPRRRGAGIKPPKVVFVFPGQGGQWNGMGRGFYEREPIFRQSINRCDAALAEFSEFSIEAVLSGRNASSLQRIDQVQPFLFALQVALAELWRFRGVEPAMVIGHSMGEVAAAHVAGALSLRDAAKIICLRSRLLRRCSGQGAMILAELNVEQAENAIRSYAGRVAVAASNSPSSTVLSGPVEDLGRLSRELESQEIPVFPIKVDVASHGPQVEALRGELIGLLEGITPRTGRVPICSTVQAALCDGSGMTPSYWFENLRKPVLFASSIELLGRDHCDVFLELSPHPTLLPSIQDSLKPLASANAVLPSMRREDQTGCTLLESLGSLYGLGSAVSWESLHPQAGRRLRLPSYPWQRQSYWLEPVERRDPPVKRTRDEFEGAVSARPRRVEEEASPNGPPEVASREAPLEEVVAELWREILGTERIDRSESFFRLGGHSLLAIRLLARVREQFGIKIPFSVFVISPTIEGMASRLREDPDTWEWSSLVPIQPFGTKPPVYCLAPIMGTVFPFYPLALALGKERPFFALQPPGMRWRDKTPARLPDLARHYAQAIRASHRGGVIHLVGWSFGATAAIEVARILKEEGERLGSVVMLDTPAPVASQRFTLVETWRFFSQTVLPDFFPYVKEFARLVSGGPEDSLGSRARALEPLPWSAWPKMLWAGLPLLRVFVACGLASLRFKPRRFAGPVLLMRTESLPVRDRSDASWGWNQLADSVETHWIPGNHMTLLRPPHVQTLAWNLADRFEEAESR